MNEATRIVDWARSQMYSGLRLVNLNSYLLLLPTSEYNTADSLAMKDCLMIIVYVDGLTEPVNPGGVGAVGFAAYRDDERLCSEGRIVGEGPEMSNNRAEYEALCEALRWLVAKNLTNEKILVKSDSRLLVNQMQDKWKIKDGLYLEAYKKARCLADQFADLSFEWISREMNKEADSLTREAYRGYISKRHIGHG